jgi:Autophagy protein 16 (ATG16)
LQQQQKQQGTNVNAGAGAGATPQSVLLADLAAAQRSRSELQDQLTRTTTELDKLKSKTQQDARRIASLEGERTHLTLRLRDRDEELRGKAKLLDVCVARSSFLRCLETVPNLADLGQLLHSRTSKMN